MRAVKLLLAAILVAGAGSAMAQAWPAKPVRLVCPTPAGTPVDLSLRLVAERLSKTLGRQFIVDNVLGGGGLIATQQVARASPDGYTYFLGGVGLVATDRHMYKSLPYNPDRDFVPVAVLYDSAPFGVAVHPDVPVQTLKDLIEYAKANPGKLSYGSDSVGVTAVTGQWFNKVAGTEIVAIPYKTPAQLMTDAAAGRTQVLFTSVAALNPYQKSGKLRMLAVTSNRKLPTLPDVPTVGETLPGFKVVGIGILFAPAGTPADIVQRMNREIDPIVKDAEYIQKLLPFGFTTLGGAGTPQQIAEFMRSERENWDTMLKGVRIEPQ